MKDPPDQEEGVCVLPTSFGPDSKSITALTFTISPDSVAGEQSKWRRRIVWDIASGIETSVRPIIVGEKTGIPDQMVALSSLAFAPPDLSQDDTDYVRTDAMAVSPNGRMRVVTNYDAVNLVDTATGSVVAVLENRSTWRVDSALFSPNSRVLALNYHDSPARIFNVTRPSQSTTLPDKEQVVAFSPNGCIVVSQGESSIKVWDAWELTVDQAKVR